MVSEIDRDEVARLIGDGAQLVDVLPFEEYREFHIAGANNLPLKRLDGEAVRGLDRLRPVIVYCNDFT
jgi:rhodanese-related sulfurtransferase